MIWQKKKDISKEKEMAQRNKEKEMTGFERGTSGSVYGHSPYWANAFLTLL